MKKYDYLIVGAGLFGAVFAYNAIKNGKTCLVIDKRDHIGGNIYLEKKGDIAVHKYGAHIFHTSDKDVWDFVNNITEFNRYTNCPIANYKGELYHLPFNMNTFYKLFGTITPKEAKEVIAKQVAECHTESPHNLEEQALNLVGYDIYNKLIKGYTEKQWGQSATELPAFIIKRLPLRFTYDNNYFNDKYQGIPNYNQLIEKLFNGADIKLSTDFFENKKGYMSCSNTVLFTGMIDEFFEYKYGELEYRSLKFEHIKIDEEDFQGNAVINYTERKIPFTRIIEHKHFENIKCDYTIITKEYPKDFENGDEPYYPVNNEKNNELYSKYKTLAENQNKVIFGGRLAEYKYYDMDKVIRSAMDLCNKIF